MIALVVYESVYGNTRAVAEAIAEGLGDAKLMSVHEAAAHPERPALLVVGGPTHMHGLATSRSRQAGARAEGTAHVEPDATEEPGLRDWLRDLREGDGDKAAAFDTRLDKSAWLTGAAAHGIARRLSHLGYDVVGSESFLVEDSPGPLSEGELDRAREWGRRLAAGVQLPAATAPGGAR
jgi:Flavodoxin